MLRRLPRVLGLALRRAEAGGPRALHALQGSAAEERDNGSSRLRAAFAVSALAAGSALMSTSTRAAAEAASVAKPADVLQGLKSLADAKEIVLYQYEVCPFCNKARAARCVPDGLALSGPRVTSSRPSWTSTRSPTAWWRSTRFPRRS